MPKCTDCGHEFADHADRALVACAPDVKINGTPERWTPLTQKCYCRGYRC